MLLVDRLVFISQFASLLSLTDVIDLPFLPIRMEMRNLLRSLSHPSSHHRKRELRRPRLLRYGKINGGGNSVQRIECQLGNSSQTRRPAQGCATAVFLHVISRKGIDGIEWIGALSTSAEGSTKRERSLLKKTIILYTIDQGKGKETSCYSTEYLSFNKSQSAGSTEPSKQRAVEHALWKLNLSHSFLK